MIDHNSNGFAEKSGWVGEDDGLLVLDRNGNGTIDNGKELFGDQTFLNNGSRAVNGFQASILQSQVALFYPQIA